MTTPQHTPIDEKKDEIEAINDELKEEEHEAEEVAKEDLENKEDLDDEEPEDGSFEPETERDSRE